MPVTLDCAAALGPTGQLEPVWKVWCSDPDHYRWQYLFAGTGEEAVARAVQEYGWVREGRKVLCPGHRHG